MATLEDKILGEKLENYCSSSEDDLDDDDGNAGYEDASDGESKNQQPKASGSGKGLKSAAPEAGMAAGGTYFTPAEKWSGQSANTGPKGVIKDWQRFKQLETEKNEERERERLELMKKLSITGKTAAETEEQKKQDELDAELAELLNDDETLLEFQRQRMMEMMQHCGHPNQYGQLFNLTNGDEFLNAVDKQNKLTTVLIHIYENHIKACQTMNKCLQKLAEEYLNVKFCKIIASAAGVSKDFKSTGCPALLIYKAGNLIGNFVRISNDLGGDEFFASDVEGFLIEHGMLPDKSLAPAIVQRNGRTQQNDSSDDDD